MRNRLKKKRILFFQLSFFPGIHGNAVQLLALCKRLQKEGYETRVLTTRYRPDYPVRDTIEGVPVYRLPPYGPGKWQVLVFYLSFLSYLIRNSPKYDILHLTTAGWINFLAPGLMRVMGKRSVYTTILSGYDDPGYFLGVRHGRLKVRLLTKTDQIITVSRALYYNCLDHGIPEEKLVYIPYGANTELFRPARGQDEKQIIRKKLGLPQDKTIAVFAGMIIRRKGADIAINVWQRIVREKKDALLLMAGARSREENPSIDEGFVAGLELAIEKSGLKENVVMMGLLPGPEKMAELFRGADIFFFPSRREGLPNTLLEAMASGLPPWSACCRGQRTRW